MNQFLKKKTEIGIGFLLLAIIFNGVFLFSEVSIPAPALNDEVLHLLTIQEASSALRHGQDPTDFWLPQIALGFPLFHHYQHLPQLILAVIDQFTSLFLPLFRLFDLSRYFLLILFPLSIFWALRRFGFDYLAAGLSALVASLFSTNGLYGLDYGSYIWRGTGLYPQLWAMVFLPLALAEIYRAVRKEGSWFWPVFLSTIVLLSNLIYGYILFLSAIIFIFLQFKKTEIISRLKRLTLIFLLIGLVTSYFFILAFLDQDYFNRTVWFESFRYDSSGAIWVLKNLFMGNLLDYGRFPSLTIIFFLALVALIVFKKYKEENYLFLFSLTILLLLLYFGRPTWGVLFNILPFSQDLQLNRFIGGFHLGVILVIGAGGALVWQWIRQRFLRFAPLFLIIFLALLLPVYIERVKYYSQNSQWRLENQQTFQKEKESLSAVWQKLRELPPGRIYSGLAGNWGRDYRVGFVPLYAFHVQEEFDSLGYLYHSFSLASDIMVHFDDGQFSHYNLFNVRYVLLPSNYQVPPFYNLVDNFGAHALYQVLTTGYFDLVKSDAVFYGEKKDFYNLNRQWLFSSLSELKQHPILVIGDKPKEALSAIPFQGVNEKTLSGLAQPSAFLGQIFQEEVGLNRYWVQFQSTQEGYLLLKVNYHPGWQVYLDSRRVLPVILTPGFIGIKVEPGTHQALFLYKSPAFRLPLLILGIFILGGLAIISQKNYFLVKFKKVGKNINFK